MIRPGCKVKPKSKIRHELAGTAPHYTATSDDIWMKNWGYESEGMFDAAKEAEMSVSDPEEYLVSRSDEDTLFPPHMPPGEDPDTGAVTLNSEQHHRLLGSGDMLGSRDNEDDYVTSIEFNECVERGLFCREADSMPVIHYHCPCCIKHSETTIQEIEQHYRHCVSTMSNQNALFTSICKHDDYITFQECRTLDQDCPAREVKLPIHYHCPCCLIFTQQSIGQVVRHQLTCCKTLTMLQPSQIEMAPMMAQSTDNMCTHDLNIIRFRLCFTSYCLEDDPAPGPNLRKNLHFHCTCCNMYCDSKLRTLRKHQRVCCVYSRFGNQHDVQPKVLFLMETSAALEQHVAIVASNNRKRNINSVTADPMSILATRTKVQKKASSVLAEIDSSIFSKCMDGSPICIVNERYRRAHYHCPICKGLHFSQTCTCQTSLQQVLKTQTTRQATWDTTRLTSRADR
ncbi:uncharacterized protein LOC134816754 isoform X1 [Bolinopsis microptera]|uniref:uncharacterized protein LOC134816754 isoform X1 n=1 Tax=Bolinopsis microptera TaxID=2820187 RepID=UPI00307927D9